MTRCHAENGSRPCTLGHHHAENQQQRGPLRFGEPQPVGPCPIAPQLLEPDPRRRVADDVPRERGAGRCAPQHEHRAGHDNQGDHDRLERLNGEQPHAYVASREAFVRVLVPVLHTPRVRFAVAASDHQTAASPAREKDAEPQRRHVEIRQHRLAECRQERRRGAQDRHFVVVVHQRLPAGDDLGRHRQDQEGDDAHCQEARDDQSRASGVTREEHRQAIAEEEPGHAADLKAGPSSAEERQPRANPHRRSCCSYRHCLGFSTNIRSSPSHSSRSRASSNHFDQRS